MQHRMWAAMLVGLTILLAGVGCRSVASATPDEIDPTAIEASVRSQIATLYPDETFDLGVDVSKEGVVTLSGDVDSAEQRRRIGDAARAVDGVTRVVNNLTVE